MTEDEGASPAYRRSRKAGSALASVKLYHGAKTTGIAVVSTKPYENTTWMALHAGDLANFETR